VFSSIRYLASKKGTAGNRAVNLLVAKGEGLLKRSVRVGDLMMDGMDVHSMYAPYLPMLQLPSISNTLRIREWTLRRSETGKTVI